MQAQVRDHSANIQTRLNILKLKPNQIQNWIGFILAQHLVIICFNHRKATMNKC